MFKFYLILSCLFAFSNIQSQGIEFFEGTWDEAVSTAEQQGKLVFVDAYTTWCGPCKMMSRSVFTAEQVGEYFNKQFISIKIDMEKPEGREFGRKFPVSAFPTLFFINGQGQLVKKVVGARRVEDLVNLAKKVVGSIDYAKDFREEYEKGDRSFDVVHGYVTGLNKSNQPSLKIANDYLLSDHNMSAEQMDLFVYDAMTDVDSKIFDLFKDRIKAYQSEYGKDKVDAKLTKACLSSIQKAVEFDAPSIMDNALEIYQKYMDQPDPYFASMQKIQYAIDLNQTEEFTTYSNEFFKLKPTADMQFDWAGNAFKHFKKNKQVMKFGAKKLKKESNKSNEFKEIVLYANLLYYADDLDGALFYLEKSNGRVKNETLKNQLIKHSERLKSL